MATVYLTDHDARGEQLTHTADTVLVKATGWVKVYDNGENNDGATHYPPHMVEKIAGDVTHNNHGTKGRI